MFTLASAIEKDDKYKLKARNLYCVKGIFSLQIYIYLFFETKIRCLFLFVLYTSEILKKKFGTQYPFVFVLAGREY